MRNSVPSRINRFSKQWNASEWNSQIRNLVAQNNPHKALSLFFHMKQNGIVPNNFTFPFTAKACGLISSLKHSQIIHAHIIKSPHYRDVFVQTALLDAYVKCGAVEVAHKVFAEMPARDVASWNAMIAGFAQFGCCENVFCLFREMRLVGLVPDSVTVMGLCRVVSEIKSLELAKGAHSFGIHTGLDADVCVANTFVSVYANCGDLGSAMLVFDGIGSGLRTLVSWNALIAGCASFGKFIDALSFYKCMLQDGFIPDISSIVSLLSSCGQPQECVQVKLVHVHGIGFGCDSDIHVVNTLISVYSKCGDIDSARCLFDSMCGRSVVSWTVMINGYAENGDLDEALALFNAMEASGEEPDLVTVLSLISGCGRKGALEVGKWIDTYANSKSLKSNALVCNALIDMYAKCGSICDARELFSVMPKRTVVSWTTMIAGCALSGLFKEALELFDEMVKLEFKPNEITFLAVLQACTHAGCLEKGWEYLHIMTEVHNIIPGLDHYSCIVDLLGRRGMIKETLEFILGIPIKPDAAMWSALLSACKLHHNIEIGQFAANRLLELEPHEAVPYVEMANLYASACKWQGVARLRKLMKSNKVNKFPGQSLIEMNGKIYTFTVDDKNHLDLDAIYEVLANLVLQMKEEGFSHLSDNADEHHVESYALRA